MCCTDTAVCIKLMLTDYTNSPALNAEFQCYSMVVQVASKVFVNVCTFRGSQTMVLVSLSMKAYGVRW